MRGKARSAGISDMVGGITPAYAGKRVMDNCYLDYY